MTSMLAKYEAACRAVAEVSKAKEIRDKAVAMAVYARQAKNKELEIDAELIRSQAERRLGQLIERQWATEGKASGRPKIPSEEVVISPKAKLADAGIDWKLSSRARAESAW